jgi:hypothetical protein
MLDILTSNDHFLDIPYRFSFLACQHTHQNGGREMKKGWLVLPFLLLGLTGRVFAAEPTVKDVMASVDTVWVIVSAVLVFLMQAGFALLEAGATRMKNAGHIAGKNVLSFAGSITYEDLSGIVRKSTFFKATVTRSFCVMFFHMFSMPTTGEACVYSIRMDSTLSGERSPQQAK